MRITFHGAARGVTGSRHLLEAGGRRLLVDCGLFQGLKELRERNWRHPGFEASELDAVLLTHAHLDHAGYLPRLTRHGLQAPVHCTEPTAELLELLLMDAARLQEEDAAWANKKGFSKHSPALPLSTVQDAWLALKLRRSHPYGRPLQAAPGLAVQFHNAGHILGAAGVQVETEGSTVFFSGDVGRYDAPLHRDPEPLPACDTLVVESTYGDRQHDDTPVKDQIRDLFAQTIRRGGTVLVPAFAIGRTQIVTLLLSELMESGDLPRVPIHIDSPMAIDASLIYGRHLRDHTLDDLPAGRAGRLFAGEVRLHRTVHDSKELNRLEGPRVIVAASGMMTGGRVLHHLARLLPGPDNLILLAGFQAAGTRGRSLQEGASHLRLHGRDIPVVARHATIHGLSSHADADELLRWIAGAPRPPRRIFVVHGEERAALAFAERLREATAAEVTVPSLGESFEV